MNARLAHILLRLFPQAWRERYGAEFAALLEDGPGTVRTVINVMFAAIGEHILPTQGRTMNEHAISLGVITRQPSALVPLTMSVGALAVVFGHVAIYGVIHEADEGSAAHIWQILMVLQVPALGYFLFRWLRRAPKQAVEFLVLQGAVIAANGAAVFFLT